MRIFLGRTRTRFSRQDAVLLLNRIERHMVLEIRETEIAIRRLIGVPVTPEAAAERAALFTHWYGICEAARQAHLSIMELHAEAESRRQAASAR